VIRALGGDDNKGDTSPGEFSNAELEEEMSNISIPPASGGGRLSGFAFSLCDLLNAGLAFSQWKDGSIPWRSGGGRLSGFGFSLRDLLNAGLAFSQQWKAGSIPWRMVNGLGACI
jgi:hypothetical protein